MQDGTHLRGVPAGTEDAQQIRVAANVAADLHRGLQSQQLRLVGKNIPGLAAQLRGVQRRQRSVQHELLDDPVDPHVVIGVIVRTASRGAVGCLRHAGV